MWIIINNTRRAGQVEVDAIRILVDADACPRRVLEICRETGERYGIKVLTVASFNHNISSPCHTVVGDGSQEADIKIANMAGKGDVAVTADWGLAALCIARGAFCLTPWGREIDSYNLDFLLEERAAWQRWRRGGGRSGGPRRRTAADDRRFASSLKKMVENAHR